MPIHSEVPLSLPRRVLAVSPLAAITAAAFAAPAGAATLSVPPCVVDYRAIGQNNLKIAAAGFRPGSVVQILSTTPSNPTPTIVTSGVADGAGNVLREIAPLSFNNVDTFEQSYMLGAVEAGNPANVTAPVSLTQVRFGFTANPSSGRANRAVTYTARGFLPGRPVYAHFRFRGKTRRNVKIGTAAAPCGVVSKRMRLLPTRVRYGTWTVYMDQVARYSPATARANPLLSARGTLRIRGTFR